MLNKMPIKISQLNKPVVSLLSIGSSGKGSRPNVLSVFIALVAEGNVVDILTVAN